MQESHFNQIIYRREEKVLKIYERDWEKIETYEFPIINRLEIVFKNMLKYITGYSFREDEAFEE